MNYQPIPNKPGINKPGINESDSELPGNSPAILPAGKSAGIGVHFASLPGPHGIGDIGDSALAFVDTLVSMKISVWQFLPTGPTAYGDSPYQPLSAFAGNEMLIGIDPLIRLGGGCGSAYGWHPENQPNTHLEFGIRNFEFGIFGPSPRSKFGIRNEEFLILNFEF